MRNHLEKRISAWMRRDDKVVFLAADIGGGLFKNLASEFGSRVINVGIGEQNMIGMASGLSDMGFRVICYSKSCFVTLRVVDQVKNAVCYPERNVIIVGADSGLDESNAGHGHIALEDIGVMNALDNIDIFMPTTFHGLDIIFEYLISSKKPAYVRLNKEKTDEMEIPYVHVDKFSYYLKMSDDKEKVILSYGVSAIGAVGYAKENNCSVIAVDSLRNIDKEFADAIGEYRKIIVHEEQLAQNGLYDRLCRVLFETGRSVNLIRTNTINHYSKVCFYRQDRVEI